MLSSLAREECNKVRGPTNTAFIVTCCK